jgi:integrase
MSDELTQLQPCSIRAFRLSFAATLTEGGNYMAECIPKDGNKYRIRIFCRRDENGKKIYCYDKTLIFESVKKRKEFIRDIETKHEDGTLHKDTKKDKVTLNAYLDRWLDHKKPHLDLNTYQDYEWNLEHYIRHFKTKEQPDAPCFGDRPLTSIKSYDIQEVYDDMLNRDLSARSIGNLHNVISQALKKAVWWDLIPSNPADRTERPKVKRGRIEVLQPEEAPMFLEAAKNDRLEPLFTFMLSNGVRPEEAGGLKWSEVDLKKGQVIIFRVIKWNRKGGGWRLREYPKTDAGWRTLHLDPKVVTSLLHWKKKQLMERLKAGKRYKNHDLVFCTPTGEPLYPTNVHRRHFHPVLKAAKIKSHIRLYGLRHSFATLSLVAGVDAKKVSHDLGHESVAFTLDTYVHIVEKMHSDAKGKLQSILFPKTTKKG